MPYKFEKLEVYQLALDYCDLIYDLSALLPRAEEYNLKSQIRRAATSIVLNIAEGSTGQTDPEQARFIGMALRSLFETVACIHLIKKRDYITDPDVLEHAYDRSQLLARKLQAMRNAIAPKSYIRENSEDYSISDESKP